MRRRVLLVSLALLVVSSAAAAAASLAEGGAGTGKAAKTFVGNFEIGPPGWGQFSGLQYEDVRPLQDSFALVGDPVRSGARAARITLPQGYSKFGYNESTQLVHFSDEQPGDDYWYAFSVNFPRDWFPPYRWGIFAEWHATLETSPVIAFNARSDTATLSLLSGLTDEQANTSQYAVKRPLLATLSKGKWNDFVMHVRWSKTNGEVEVWHKLAGQQRLRRLVRLAGMPTFQWTSSGKGIGIYLLFGLYRGSYCPQPTQLDCTSSQGVQAPNTLYLDSYARASSFEAVTQAAFPRERMVLCTPARGSGLRCPRNRAARANE
jgi:hypothetical protein